MSTVMLRSLSLGEALDTSLTLYRRLFAQLLGVSLATQAVPLALSTYIDSAGGAFLQYRLFVLYVGLAAVLGALGTAASTFLVSEHYLGRSIGTGEALRHARHYLSRLIALTFATALIVGVGLVFLIVPGAILFSGLIVGTPALVIENIPGAANAMQRSWSLSSGFRGKLFMAYLLGFLLLFIPTIAVGSLVSFLGPDGVQTSMGSLATNLFAALLQILIYPFLYVLTTVLYYDLRVRKEGFDLEMLASTLQPA